MPGTKEIRNKISSVKSTQKITKAMEMVAASKMRRAQDRMRLSRPYAEKIRNVIGHLKKANPDYKHPYLIEREAQSIGIIVVSSDRGLCGALNTNVFKTTLTMMREWQGMEFGAMGQVLGISEDAARMRFHRALPRLAAQLERIRFDGGLFAGRPCNPDSPSSSNSPVRGVGNA